MNRFLSIMLSLIMVVASLTSNLCYIQTTGSISSGNEPVPYQIAEGRYTIRTAYEWSDSYIQQAISQLPAHTIEYFDTYPATEDTPAQNVYFLNLTDASNHNTAYNILSSITGISVVCDTMILGEDVVLSDMSSSAGETYYQWGLDKIEAREAWNKGFDGSNTIKVAVLDSGINLTHEDLVANVDMTLAWNANLNNTDVNDTFGHGTNIIGIIGSSINNIGIDGICKNVSITPIKITVGTTNFALQADIAKAIKYCSDNDFDIINLSYSLPLPSTEVIAAVQQFDGLFIQAAGNNGHLLDDHMQGFCNNISNWMVVGGSTLLDERKSSSNYSQLYVDLFAPGADIWCPDIGTSSSYECYSGTSLAAPHVAAAAALIMSRATHLTSVQVKQLLMDTVDPVAAFDGLCVSNGRLNVNNAVDYLYAEQRPAFSLGDVNGDGYVNTTDRTTIRSYIMGENLNAAQLAAADINGDGAVSSADMTLIGQYISKKLYFAPY